MELESGHDLSIALSPDNLEAEHHSSPATSTKSPALPSPTVDEFSKPRGSEPKHVESLDGLRAIAIFAVMGVHAKVPGFSMGWLGVELFFVLSGFLITSLLLREKARNGKIHLLKFWGRRFLRLMPAYWLYAALITFLLMGVRVGWTDTEGGWSTGDYLRAIWLYYINFVPQGGIWQYQQLTVHLWSLAVEEQFYFIWPIVCYFFIGKRRLTFVTWLAFFASAAVMILTPSPDIFTRLHARGFSIMLGCAFALTLNRIPSLNKIFWNSRVRIFIAATVFLSVSLATLLQELGYISLGRENRFVTPILCFGFAGLIAMLWFGPNDGIARSLSWRPLVYVGKISYGMYLYHMLAHVLTWEVLLNGIEHWNQYAKFGLRVIVYSFLTFAIASLSFYWVERPFLMLKSKLR